MTTDEFKLVSRVERTLYRVWICDINGCEGEMTYTGHAAKTGDNSPIMTGKFVSSSMYVHRCSTCERIGHARTRYPISEPLARQVRGESSLDVNRVRLRLADKPNNPGQNLLDLCRALDEIELQRLVPTADVHDTIAYLLDVHFFLDQLRTKVWYERQSDGDEKDGKGQLRKLSVKFDELNNAIISVNGHTAMFATGGEGGMSRRTRTALLILAEAIRLDNIQTPIKKRK